MPGFRIPRRSFLRGLGGVAVGLPALEIMGAGRAFAQAAPKRFVVSFGGISTGADGTDDDLCVPDGTGPGYEVRPALSPLTELGIAGEVSLVSGLLIPWEDGGVMPPGGRTIYYHYNTVGPQVAGTYAGEQGVGEDGRDGAPKGPTCDQIVADQIAGDTTNRVLTYRVQPASYVGSNDISGNSGRLSWRDDGDGNLRSVDPTVSPRLAYESLFAGFTPDDPREAERARALLRRRTSVLDLVRGGTERLMPRLGRSDRIRMERHFEEIRALERRLAETPEVVGACRLLEHPGDDPDIGGSIIEYEGQGQPYSTNEGYSDEERRAEVMTDLIAMAFACDQSRVASFMLTEWKCYMNMFALSDNGWEVDMHEATHQGNQVAVSEAIAWHVRQWGRLVQKLRDTPDADGTNLLDSSALVMLFEGGWGFDPEGGTEPSAHSTQNMIALIAGRAGGLVPGQHVSAPDAHPASVVVSAMRAVGVEGGLGEISDDIPELFGA